MTKNIFYITRRLDPLRGKSQVRWCGSDPAVGEKMIHCYPLLAPMFPEATQEIDAICGFIRKQLAL